MDLVAFRFYDVQRPIAHRIDYRGEVDSPKYQSISISICDIHLPHCKGYLFFDDVISRLDETNLQCLWTASSIDMGWYHHIRYSVISFAQVLEDFDSEHWRSIGYGGDGEFLQKTSDIRLRVVSGIGQMDDSDFPGFFKKAAGSHAIWGACHHFLFGHSVKIDHHMRPVIDAWIKFVLWTDARCQANGGKFVITLADKEDWLRFSNSFQVPAKA